MNNNKRSNKLEISYYNSRRQLYAKVPASSYHLFRKYRIYHKASGAQPNPISYHLIRWAEKPDLTQKPSLLAFSSLFHLNSCKPQTKANDFYKKWINYFSRGIATTECIG